jgi:hypothetical protein
LKGKGLFALQRKHLPVNLAEKKKHNGQLTQTLIKTSLEFKKKPLSNL